MIRVLVVCLLLALPAWAEEAASLSRPAAVGGTPGWPLDLVQRADPVRAAPSSRDDAEDAGDVLGLDEAVTMALDHNRLVQNSTLDVAKSGNQLASDKTQRLPQFQLSVTPAYLAGASDAFSMDGPWAQAGNAQVTSPRQARWRSPSSKASLSKVARLPSWKKRTWMTP